MLFVLFMLFMRRKNIWVKVACLRFVLFVLFKVFVRMKNIWAQVDYLRFVLFVLFVLFVCMKSFREKNKTALIPSFILLLRFFQALLAWWLSKKLKCIRVIFTSYFLSYSKVYYCTQFNWTLLDYGGSNALEKLGNSSTKIEGWLMSQGKPRVVDNTHTCCAMVNWCWK